MGAQPSKGEKLYKEVQNGNIEAVKELHSSGADLEWMDEEGRTPLILLCTKGKPLEMAKTLLNLGANVNSYQHGSHGGTPLHHAAKGGHTSVVNLLLQHGGNPLAINDDFDTPLQMARARGHCNIVRIIEGRISLFSGTIRELSGPAILEALSPQWVSNKVWAVVLPSASSNPSRPPKFELVIYKSSKDSQPWTTIFLSEVLIGELQFSLPDPALVLFDKNTMARKRWHKFLSEIKGDEKQLQQLYGAILGVPQGVINNPVAGKSSSVQESLPTIESEHRPQYSGSSSKSQSNSSGTCVICWDAPAGGVCIPCGHLVGCISCLYELKANNWGCPICRTTVEQVIKAYSVPLNNVKS